VDRLDPITGEVLPDGAIVDVPNDELAKEYAQTAHEVARLQAELGAMQAKLDILAAEVRARVPVGEKIEGGGFTVVVAMPSRRPARRVIASRCVPFREKLLALGLGEVEEVYKPPTIGQVRAAQARLIAAGIPIDEIAPDPGEGEPVVEVVATG
jgi:hypothetical protein